jgi:hypothetical protein
MPRGFYLFPLGVIPLDFPLPGWQKNGTFVRLIDFAGIGCSAAVWSFERNKRFLLIIVSECVIHRVRARSSTDRASDFESNPLNFHKLLNSWTSAETLEFIGKFHLQPVWLVQSITAVLI